METLTLAGAILGGLGLFLLAIGMMTDGLKLAAGSSLRKILSEWSKTPLRGIFSGFFMTAIVQSSSAVTVASLGFVNAGLINMRQVLGIIYGANVGTTMTGWLVALIGFKFGIQAFALPMIGLGMMLKLVKQQGKAASFGLALVGFGLFFLGIDILKNAFEGVVIAFDISSYNTEGLSGVFIFFFIGIVMTILTQSSSASIALTITAASSGILGIYAAGAMVIGANIGTTSTAVIASIGATPNAKRAAAAQVIFNFGTALVAFVVLPILFLFIEWLSKIFNLTANPAISLALFHTIFNVLGVMLIYPQNDRLASFLEKRFLSWEESASTPRFLDKTIALTPVLAINALTLETLSISDKVIALYSKAIHPGAYKTNILHNETRVISLLSSKVSAFIVSIERDVLSDDTTDHLTTLMRIKQYLLSCALCTESLASQLEKREKSERFTMEINIERFLNEILNFMNATRSHKVEVESDNLFDEAFVKLKLEHDKLKADLLLEGTRSYISVKQMSEAIDCLAEAIRIAQQWLKAMTRLQTLQTEIESLNVTLNEPTVNI